MDQSRSAIAKKCCGGDEYRIARYLSEQMAESMSFLAGQRNLLNVGSIVRHVSKCLVETSMVIAPVVFHNVPCGQGAQTLAYKALCLD